MKLKLPNKKLVIISTAALCTALLITLIITNIFAASKLLKKLKLFNITENQISLSVMAFSPEKEAVYRLYECGGKIGIFEAKTNTLIDIIDVFTSTLPQNDREALKDGIDIYSFTELSNIITDFTT